MTTDTVGGVWQYSLDLASALSPLGFETTLAVLGPAASVEQNEQVASAEGVTLRETGLPLDWLSDSVVPIRQAAHNLAAMAHDLGVNLIQCNSPAYVGETDWAVPIVAVGHGCVATWWSEARQNALPASFHWHHASVRRGLLAADKVIAPSRSFAEALQNSYALPFTPEVVHNGRRFRPQPSTASQTDAAITVGRLWDEAKNADTLDRAAALASTTILAVGDLHGPQGQIFSPKRLRATGKMGERELADLLGKKPIFVSAAIFEPFGLAALEAASAGCALILSDIATFRELWADVAIFVDPSDPQGFASAVDALAKDPLRRAAMGRAAAAKGAQYSLEACAEQMAAVYDQLLAREEVAA